jgi:hypothetical protein
MFQFGIFAYLVRVVEKTLGLWVVTTVALHYNHYRAGEKKKVYEEGRYNGNRYFLVHGFPRTHLHRIPACLAAEVTGVSSALCSTPRRHVEAIYLA